MHKKIRFLSLLVILSLFLMVFGCSKANKNIGTPQSVIPSITITPSAITPTAVTPTTTPLVTTSTPSGVVVAIAPPIEMINLEKYALKIITDANSRNWKDANKRYTSMKKTISVLLPKLSAAGVSGDIVSNMNMLVNKLNTNITAKASYDTKITANEITKYIADLRAVYKVTVPLDSIRLDYYLRYIQYSLEKNDWTNAAKYAEQAAAMWKNVKPQITANNKNVKNMDKIMTALDKAVKSKNKKTTIKQAKRALITSALITKYFEAKAKRP